MGKSKSGAQFECVECGYQSLKFFGKCPQCGNWNSMIEVKEPAPEPVHGKGPVKTTALSDIRESDMQRDPIGLDEFDRVLGGGVVPGSVILIGGEPGVGKSTLLTEVSGLMARKGKTVLYYSGEESAVQIKLRATRLGVDSSLIHLLTMGTLDDLKSAVKALNPHCLIVDSIQTINSPNVSAISGSISSMRYVTSEIIELAKGNNIAAFIIGHINKEGQIAGPKLLEHMVDAVFYFQGEIKTDLRILRAEKNRFGSADELGIFQMTGKGLVSVTDPSLLFLHHRRSADSGIAVFPAVSGMRAILSEIQALVAESPFVGNPRRIAVGFDHYRLSMLISIIEKKLKLPFYKSDVFLNIAGGMTVRETAGDLAAAGALVSSYKNFAIPRDVIIIGEVGLTGEIRPVPLMESRIREAMRQGFSRFIVPMSQSEFKDPGNAGVIPVENLYEFYNRLREMAECA